MYCGQCGTKNEDYASFCANCGAKLNGVPPRNPAPAAAAVTARTRTDKKHRRVGIVAVALAAIVAIVAVFSLFGGRSYQKTAD